MAGEATVLQLFGLPKDGQAKTRGLGLPCPCGHSFLLSATSWHLAMAGYCSLPDIVHALSG